MKQCDFEKSIREAFSLLVKVGLSSWDQKITLRNLEPPEEFRRVAYSSEITYQEVYKTGLRYRAYNFVLSEYSYFQFWHDSRNDPRVLRYAYYPNPFDITLAQKVGSERGVRYGNLDIEDIYQQALEDSPLIIGKPPIRYDLDFDGHREAMHPSAHLTVGAFVNNRWPVSRVLTPRLFVLFVCKNYYPDQWTLMNIKGKSKGGYTNSLDQALADEKSASRPIGHSKFTAKEKLHPYLD